MQGDFIREKLCDIEIKNSQDDNWINNINILTLSFFNQEYETSKQMIAWFHISIVHFTFI